VAAKQKDRKEAAKEYGANLLALIKDEGVRAAVAKALEDDSVLDHLGEGVLRQSDYTRLAQEAATAKEQAAKEAAEFQSKRTEITDWYKQQLEKASAGGDPNPNPNPATAAPAFDPKIYVTKEDVAKIAAGVQAENSRTAFAWAKVITPLYVRHRDLFKEDLDIDALMEFAGKQRLPVDQAYPLFTADKRAAVEAERQKERDAKLIRETEERVRGEYAGLPHILPGQEPLGTLGGLLDDPKAKPDISVDGLVTAFNKITAEKAGRGA
jgi:hypothetical protein